MGKQDNTNRNQQVKRSRRRENQEGERLQGSFDRTGIRCRPRNNKGVCEAGLAGGVDRIHGERRGGSRGEEKARCVFMSIKPDPLGNEWVE